MPDPEMNAPDQPPPRRTPFEWSLAALRPLESDAERPSFMFKAGQASRDGVVRFWKWVAVGCVVVLAGTVGGGLFLLADARERAEVAAARAATPASRDREGAGETEKTLTPQPPLPLVGEGEKNSRPSPSPLTSPEGARGRGAGGEGVPSSPTPQEIAAALRTRRDILVAGLGLVPDGKPGPFTPDAGSSPRGWGLTTGVLTAPKITPKPPVKPEPEDLLPPEDR